MSGVFIESAYYGDEKSFANITNSLANKISGGVLDITASADLKPTFEAAPETTLDNNDQRKIREQAVDACGGEADQGCIDRTRLKLSQERLKEKETESLGKGVLKGDRLTVTIVDNGRRRTLITPAGQKLRLENILGNTRGNATAAGKQAGKGWLEFFQDNALLFVTYALAAFIWVFSAAAVYAIFMRQYEITGRPMYQAIAFATAAISLIFPGSGIVIIIGYFAFTSAIAEYITN